jgi:DNA-directed RNA polymerase subunit RPC12/RpoP
MEAWRCTDCGDTRWSLSSLGPRPTASPPRRCELCGARMVPERRHPTHAPLTLASERRSAARGAAVPPVTAA